MNIISFFKNLTEQFNNENKCGFCWEYSAPLSESGMNRKTSEDPCCTHIFITYYKTSIGYKKDGQTTLKNEEWKDHIFTLYVVRKSNLGVNIYNEANGYPISEGLWSTILEPLQNCLGDANNLPICELGYPFEVTKWDMETTVLKDDNNYTGWKVSGIFREKL